MLACIATVFDRPNDIDHSRFAHYERLCFEAFSQSVHDFGVKTAFTSFDGGIEKLSKVIRHSQTERCFCVFTHDVFIQFITLFRRFVQFGIALLQHIDDFADKLLVGCKRLAVRACPAHAHRQLQNGVEFSEFH